MPKEKKSRFEKVLARLNSKQKPYVGMGDLKTAESEQEKEEKRNEISPVDQKYAEYMEQPVNLTDEILNSQLSQDMGLDNPMGMPSNPGISFGAPSSKYYITKSDGTKKEVSINDALQYNQVKNEITSELRSSQLKQAKEEAYNKYKSGELKLPVNFDLKTMLNEVLYPENHEEVTKDEIMQYLGITPSDFGMNTLGGYENTLTSIGNIGRIGWNKLFNTNIALTTTSNYHSNEPVLDLASDVIGNLIPLTASIKAAGLILKGIKNPAIRNTLTNIIGFNLPQQPELLSGLMKGDVSPEDYLKNIGESSLMGTLFEANPFKPGFERTPSRTPSVLPLGKGENLSEIDLNPYHTQLRSTIYNALIPPLAHQTGVLSGKDFDVKQYVEDALLNAGLDIVTHGRLIRRISEEVGKLSKDGSAPLTTEILKEKIDNAVDESADSWKIKRKLENRDYRRKSTEVPEETNIEGTKGNYYSWEPETMRVELRKLGYRNKDIEKMSKYNKVFIISGGRVGDEWTGRGPVEKLGELDATAPLLKAGTTTKSGLRFVPKEIIPKGRPEIKKEEIINPLSPTPLKGEGELITELIETPVKDKSELKIGDKVKSKNYFHPEEELEITDLRKDNMIKVRDTNGYEGLISEKELVKLTELPKPEVQDEFTKLELPPESGRGGKQGEGEITDGKILKPGEVSKSIDFQVKNKSLEKLREERQIINEQLKQTDEKIKNDGETELSKQTRSSLEQKLDIWDRALMILHDKSVTDIKVKGHETLQSELETAKTERKPVNTDKYLQAYFNKSVTEGIESPEVKALDELHKAAKEHNYSLSKELISEAIKKQNIDFGGLSKLSDVTQPKVLRAVYNIGVYHYEKLRDASATLSTRFGKWAKAMTDDIGPKIRRHLENIWSEVKKYFTGEKSLIGEGFGMNIPPPKGRRPDHQEKLRMAAISKISELVNKYGKEIESEGKYSDIDAIERIRQKVRTAINNLDEFKNIHGEERRKITEAVQVFYKNRSREVLNIEENPFIEEFTERKHQKWFKQGIRQSLKIVEKMGEAGEDFAGRIDKMHDREREMMGVPSMLYLEYKKLSPNERREFGIVRNRMMLEEQETTSIDKPNVRRLNEMFNEYYKAIEGKAEDLGMETFDISSNSKRSFKGRKVYDPRILDMKKIQEIYQGKKAMGRSKFNRISEMTNKAERIYQHMVDTGQAKNRADAIEKLNKYIAKRTQVAKAGNVEFSRIEDVRLPAEYYVQDPLRRLVDYATKIARRISHAEQFGVEGDIASTLLDKMKSEGHDEPYARELYRFETGNLTEKEKSSMGDVSALKGFMAVTKFSPFTTLRNSLQGFLGSTTRGNLKAGITGLIRSFTKTAKENAYHSGALADTIESVIIKDFGGDSNFVRTYLEIIGFAGTDRNNRVISATAGEVFYKDMLKRIQNDSVLKKRAIREFEKLGLDPEEVVKRGSFTEEELDMIRRRFSGDAQFNIRPSDLPLFWSSALGKLVTQWKPFSYKMTQMIYDNVIGELKHGNVLPLLTFIGAYNIGGEAVSIIIDAVRSLFNFNPRKEKDFESVTDKMLVSRIANGEWDKFADRIVDNLTGLGALSMFVDIFRSIGYGKSPTGDITPGLSNLLLGPTLSSGVTALADIFGPAITAKWGNIDEDEAENTFKKTLRGLYKQIFTNVPFGSFPRTVGLTKEGERWLFGSNVKGIEKYFPELKDKGINLKKIIEINKEEKQLRKLKKKAEDEKDRGLVNEYKEKLKELERKQQAPEWQALEKLRERDKKQKEKDKKQLGM